MGYKYSIIIRKKVIAFTIIVQIVPHFLQLVNVTRNAICKKNHLISFMTLILKFLFEFLHQIHHLQVCYCSPEISHEMFVLMLSISHYTSTKKMSMTHSFSDKVNHAGNELRFSCSNSLIPNGPALFFRVGRPYTRNHTLLCIQVYRTVIIISEYHNRFDCCATADIFGVATPE